MEQYWFNNGYQDGENEKSLEAFKGIAAGDLFSVLEAGQPITHPVSGEVIGHLDRVKNVLKVIRVKAGYSFARPIRESPDLKPGTPIGRYECIQRFSRTAPATGGRFL